MNEILAFGMPSMPEMMVILVIILLLFGAKKLPELAKGLGKSIKEFKKATSEVEDSFRDAMKEEDKKTATKLDSSSTEAKPEEKKEDA